MEDHEHKTLIKQYRVHKAHNYLCDRFSWYHSWHHHPHHQKMHWTALSVYIVIIFSLIFQSVVIPSNNRALAATTTDWNMTTSTDYTYDSDKIEFTGGVAQLKPAYTPGTDWIANDGGGNSWLYRKQITITNNIASELSTGYSVNFTFDHATLVGASKSLTSGDDIRIVYQNGGSTEIARSIDEASTWNSATTKIWFKTQATIASSSTDTNYYVYYGNSSASAPTVDKNDVFAFWDDFNNGNADGWVSAAGGGTLVSATIVDNQYKIDVNSNWYFFWNPAAGTFADYEQVFKVNAEAFDTSHKLLASLGRVQDANGLYMMGRWSNLYNLYRRNAGGWTSLKTSTAASANEIGVQYYVKTQFIGYTLKFKTWQVGTAEPESWGDTVVDGSSSWANGYIGIAPYANIASYDDIQIRNIVTTEPTTSAGSEAGIYPTTNPTLVPNTGQGYGEIYGFTETLGGGSTGTIKYQISPDDGSTWYWWSGAAWTVTSAGYTESNIASDINTYLADESFNSIGSDPKTFLWRAYLNSDSTQLPKLDNIALEYTWDTADPDNPASLTTAKSQKTDGADITTNTWYGHASPYFTWATPSDNANPGETISGIAGYYVYFGTSATGDPTSQRGIATELGGTGIHYQIDTDFEIGTDTSALVSGSTYYLRIETADNAGNIKQLASEDPSLFIYKYDGVAPTSPIYVSVSPSGYTRTNAFTFSWPIEGVNAATDTGGSSLAGYQYKINSEAWSDTITGGSIAFDLEDDIADQGVNIFYLRAVDNAGNSDATPVQTNFYYNNVAPTAPVDILVSPETTVNTPAISNAFTFSWDVPLSGGEIAGYYYSINTLPTLANSNYVTDATIGPSAFATQQGENTFYIVARDNAGNYDLGSCNSISGNPTLDSCAKVSFYAITSAPGAPTTLQSVDGSNRDLEQYKVFLTWTEPAEKGTGFSGYEIFRSTDNLSFTSVGTTSGTTYADTNLESIRYYYYVKAKDNAGQYSAASSTVNLIPTGSYTSPPTVVETSDGLYKVEPKSFSVVVSWQINREADQGFVDCGKTIETMGENNGGKTGADRTTSVRYSIKVDGLEPSTEYHCKAIWIDSDGNQGEGSNLTLTTNARPEIRFPVADNLTINSARISWESTTVINSVVRYCPAVGGICNTVRDYADLNVEKHEVYIYNLADGTEYSFTVEGEDIDGKTITSSPIAFTTIAKPKVLNFTYEPIKDAPTTSLKLSWTTNVETTTIATYQAGAAQSSADPEYKLKHEISITGLSDKTTYVLQAKGVDRYGNQCQSDAASFTTPNDTRSPKLSNMTVEIKSMGFGATQKAQIIVTWQTDEPGTSQVEYAQGISGAEYNNKSKEDTALSTSHAVIIPELEPSKIYHLRAVSRDSSGNPGYSDDTTTITGKSQKSVLDIIMNSLQTSLGWIFTIFQ